MRLLLVTYCYCSLFFTACGQVSQDSQGDFLTFFLNSQKSDTLFTHRNVVLEFVPVFRKEDHDSYYKLAPYINHKELDSLIGDFQMGLNDSGVVFSYFKSLKNINFITKKEALGFFRKKYSSDSSENSSKPLLYRFSFPVFWDKYCLIRVIRSHGLTRGSDCLILFKKNNLSWEEELLVKCDLS